MIASLPSRAAHTRVVYTCMFGYSEHFEDIEYNDPDVDYICFTDDPYLKSDVWQFVVVNDTSTDPARVSKRHKHLPHVYLPQYEESIYVDNTVKLKVEPTEVFNRFGGHSMVLVRHPRDCIYAEAAEVIRLQYDDPEIVRRQMQIYRNEGYPERNGLNACCFIVRNHRCTLMQAACNLWNKHTYDYSKRDQLSWNYCAWKLNFSFTTSEHLKDNSLFDWPALTRQIRVPRHFDDELYLSLNPDVRNSGMNPRRHYLHHGASEGRRYR